MTNGSWLPVPSADDEPSHGLWAPSDLPAPPEELSYVVVEEILGNAVGLAVSDWPEVDAHGRLRFSAPANLIGVDRTWLEQELDSHRATSEIDDRPIRIGDAFAVRNVEVGASDTNAELTIRAWQPPIYDITTEARAAAKTALYAAVAPVLDPEQARGLNAIIDEREE